MMIELKGRGFALLATVLSFIADNRDTQESIRWRLGFACKFRSNSQRRGDNPSLVGFRHSRAGPEKAESGGDSQAARVMIHPAGWEEASLDGKTLFAGFAGTHDVGCSFRTVSTRGGADVRCQRELCDQAHAAG